VTVPGLIVSEIVRALAVSHRVTRVEVDVDDDFNVGLHRAPSLAAANGAHRFANLQRHRAPNNLRLRLQAFRDWITPDTGIAIAYAWPGLDNSWIKHFLHVAHGAGASTVVLCESLPHNAKVSVAALSDVVSRADRIVVGDASDAKELRAILGSHGPSISAHRALSLGGRKDRPDARRITAFLPRDHQASLATVLAAFDAIPEAWVSDFKLQLVTRYAGDQVPDMVASSFHAEHIRLIGEDLSSLDLGALCDSSSALGVADPAADSRVFSTAMDKGVATVVLSSSPLLAVGTGYVGGLIADVSRPASVHVALHHALRFAALRFPTPDAWRELAVELVRHEDDDRLDHHDEMVAQSSSRISLSR
jgi:hypothetical protein